jgi:flagellar basal-body rod modification protein FlgD
MSVITSIPSDKPIEKMQLKGVKELSKDNFIKLFLTQLKMQSPLKPLQSSEMMQQMSQLTSLSATQELEKTIKSLNANLGKSQVLQASQLIGKKIQLLNNTSPLTPLDGLSGSIVLPSAAQDLTVMIKDKNENVVKTIKLGDVASNGLVDFKWDGKDEAGNLVQADFYKISATGNLNGQITQLPTAGTFKVNSVGLDNRTDGVILNLEGIGGVNMEDVIKIL